MVWILGRAWNPVISGTWDWSSHISTILGECTCAVPGLSVALNDWGEGGGTLDWPSHISTILGECTCAVPGLSVALNVWGGTWDWPSHISTIPGECTCTVPGLSVALNVWGGGLGTGLHTFLLYLVSVHVQYQGCW